MLTLILSLLGGGGVIGAALFFIPGLGLAISRIVAAIPPKVWFGIAAAIALGLAFWLHQSHASQEIADARAAGKAEGIAEMRAEVAKIHADAVRWRDNYQITADQLSTAKRRLFDDEIRSTAALADALRLRGPGKAAAPACGRSGDSAGPSANTSGHEPAGGPVDAPVAPMSPDEPLAVLPWSGVTRFGEYHDEDRTEVLTWRSWYLAQAEILRLAKQKLPTPKLGNQPGETEGSPKP